MTTKLKRLIEDYGRRKALKDVRRVDFDHLSEKLRLHHVNLHSQSLARLWRYVHTPERPKRKTLDRLALFAGFQSWSDLQTALLGEGGAQLNYAGDGNARKAQ